MLIVSQAAGDFLRRDDGIHLIQLIEVLINQLAIDKRRNGIHNHHLFAGVALLDQLQAVIHRFQARIPMGSHVEACMLQLFGIRDPLRIHHNDDPVRFPGCLHRVHHIVNHRTAGNETILLWDHRPKPIPHAAGHHDHHIHAVLTPFPLVYGRFIASMW